MSEDFDINEVEIEEQANMQELEFRAVFQRLADEKLADIFVISSGTIDRRLADRFIDTVDEIEQRKENVILFLCTYGGDPDAAFIIARTLKKRYKHFSLYISGYCKSAGTIIALGANEIAMGIKGELGPLDVQLPKEDSLVSRTSGLDSTKSIDVLRSEAFDLFGQTFFSLIGISGGRFTTRTAAKIATELVVGLLAPIAAQIDPLKLAENQRALDIAQKYGSQLGANENSIEQLIYRYPSHGHVIDIDEAKEIFEERVRPFDELDTLVEQVIKLVMKASRGDDGIRSPLEKGVVVHLNPEREIQAMEKNVNNSDNVNNTDNDTMEFQNVKEEENDGESDETEASA